MSIQLICNNALSKLVGTNKVVTKSKENVNNKDECK